MIYLIYTIWSIPAKTDRFLHIYELFVHKAQSNFLKVKIYSRHVRGTIRTLWLQLDCCNKQQEPIQGWHCTCICKSWIVVKCHLVFGYERHQPSSTTKVSILISRKNSFATGCHDGWFWRGIFAEMILMKIFIFAWYVSYSMNIVDQVNMINSLICYSILFGIFITWITRVISPIEQV